jgi:hypothetical protein
MSHQTFGAKQAPDAKRKKAAKTIQELVPFAFDMSNKSPIFNSTKG